jgi:hypothetical protein
MLEIAVAKLEKVRREKGRRMTNTVYGARIAYLVAAWIFVGLVLVQVFLSGLVVVAGLTTWELHRSLGHQLGLPVLFMIVLAYLGRLPRSAKALTWLLLSTFIAMAEIVIFLRGSAPLLAALHPVLALVLFALGTTLAMQALGFVRDARKAPSASQRLGDALRSVRDEMVIPAQREA